MRKCARSIVAYSCVICLLDGAFAQDSTGVQRSVAVDIVGASKLNDESSATDRLDVREAELLFEAPIDHIFDGRLSLAAHQESGIAVFEIHEAFIRSTKLVHRTRFRVGQFFLGVGRLNSFHRHEWPFIFAPKVHEEFFGVEGALDSGGEVAYLTPLPFFLEFTFGVTNGWTYGHSHDQGEKPRQPTHYGRLATYSGLFAGGGTQIGLNYLSRKAADNEKMTLLGVDIVAKWRRAGILNYFFQSEIWHRARNPDGGDEERTMGAYVFPALAITPTVQLGVLADYYTILTLEDIVGEKINNDVIGIVPTMSYKASEFSTLRLALNWTQTSRDGKVELIDRSIQTQATFMIGAHPAHDF